MIATQTDLMKDLLTSFGSCFGYGRKDIMLDKTWLVIIVTPHTIYNDSSAKEPIHNVARLPEAISSGGAVSAFYPY